MNRIDAKFAQLREQGEKAFVAYISAGDPSLAATRNLAVEFDRAGVDVLELGVPFSDPLADGIVNQMAAQRALEAGTTPAGVLECVREIRQVSQIPIVLYTYLNPLHAFGFERFHREAESAGVDGLLILDLPPDEDTGDLAEVGGLKRIRLIAPTTPPERVATIAARGDGFLYYISREGVTGEQTSVATSIRERVEEIAKNATVPIVVGFGVSNPDQAREVARAADGVVVGSAIVKKVAEFGRETDLAEQVGIFVQTLVKAVHERANNLL